MNPFTRISAALSIALCLALPGVQAGEFDTSVPMRDGGSATYYVEADLDGVGQMDFMVDTGSGYLTINEETLATLKRLGGVSYLYDLQAVLADGSEMIMPVYRIKSLSIGGRCRLTDVEAAVFPGATRQILGLSALKKAAPFIFSFDPPNLVLSNCPNGKQVAVISDN